MDIKRSSAPPLLQLPELVDQHLAPTREDEVRQRGRSMKPANVLSGITEHFRITIRASLGFIIYVPKKIKDHGCQVRSGKTCVRVGTSMFCMHVCDTAGRKG